MGKELTFNRIVRSDDYLTKLRDVYSLSILLRRSILTNEFSADNFDLKLTKYGEKVFNHLIRLKKFAGVPTSLIKVALFIDFYHEEPYFNLEEIDVEYVKNFLSSKILSKQILFPWVYDRLLYDKYFEQFDDQENYLTFRDTLKLLSGSTQGIFQINQYLTGPLGIVESEGNRLMIPKLEFELWHCHNPSCEAFHEATLNNNKDGTVFTLLTGIDNYLKNHFPAPLDELFKKLSNDSDDFFNDKSINNISAFILDNFVEDEIKLLLKNLIDDPNLRAVILKAKKLSGSAEKIIQSLNKYEACQLLLVFDDEVIVSFTEKLIYSKEIYIPSTEIRKSFRSSYKGYYNTYPECNKLGIRINSASCDLSLLRLKSLIKTIYEDNSLNDALLWKLRKYPENLSLDEKIDKYIMDEDPRKVVQETIMSGSTQLNQAFNILGGHFVIPKNDEQELNTIDKILWKLGFNINIYPNFLFRFYEYKRKFEYSVTKPLEYNDTEKDEIRSFAVNLFVSLEEILQLTLSYMTWLLLSDHYTDTKFKFVYEDAREFMASVLNNFEFSEGEFLEVDANGKNTLFPLTEGFSALFKICDKLLKEDKALYRKPSSELPHFFSLDLLKQFPFVSKRLVFDIRIQDYENIKNILGSIPREFDRVNLLAIRNRLQHKRDNFPSQNELLAVCNTVTNVISKIDNTNLFPNVFLFKEEVIDQYRKTKIVYHNHKGSAVTIFPTPEFDHMYLPKQYVPQLILPFIRLGTSSQPLRILYSEKSAYQQFWKGYPRKKSRNEFESTALEEPNVNIQQVEDSDLLVITPRNFD